MTTADQQFQQAFSDVIDQQSADEQVTQIFDEEQGGWAERKLSGAIDFVTGRDRLQGYTRDGVLLKDIPEIHSLDPTPTIVMPDDLAEERRRETRMRRSPEDATAVPPGIHESMALGLGNPVHEALIAAERMDLAPEDFEWTEDFDVIVTLPEDAGRHAGKQFFLNKPGASMGDARRMMAETLPFMVAGGGATAATGKMGLPLLGRAAGVAGAFGGLSMAADKLVGLVTDEDIDIDQRRAIFLGALGFTGEVGIALGEKLFRRLMAKPLLTEGGKLTKTGKKLVDKLGIPPEAITPETQAIFREATRAEGRQAGRQALTEAAETDVFARGRPITPAEPSPAPVGPYPDAGVRTPAEAAAAVAQAESLSSPVELTAGQATRGRRTQARELQAEAGILGDELQNEAVTRLAQQDRNLAQSASDLRTRWTGQENAVRGDAIQLPLEATREIERQHKNAVRAAYKAAREGSNLRISNAQLDDIYAAGDRVKADFDLGMEGMDAARRAVAELDRFAGLPDNAWIKLGAMADWRKRINNRLSPGIKRGEATPSDAALLQLKAAYDDTVWKIIDDEMLRRTLGTKSQVRGQVEDLQKWMAANDLRKSYAQRFEDDQVIRKWIKDNPTPEEAAAMLLGANKLGVRQGTTKTLKKLEGLLGRGSPQYQSLVAEAALQLMTDGTGKFNKAMFVRNLKTLQNKNNSLAKALFNTEQLRALNTLANVAKNTQYDPVKNALNPSGSGLFVVNAFQRAFGPAGRLIDAIISKPVRGTQRAMQQAEAKEFLSGQMPVESLFPLGGPTAQGVAGSVATAPSADPVRTQRMKERVTQ